MSASSGHDADGFFVLRTPLLPAGAYASWAGDLSAPTAGPDELAEALRRDRQLLVTRLRALYDLPEVKDALYVASPQLAARSDRGDRDEKLDRTLVKYLARMTTRPTPFGLFAGSSLGATGETTEVELVPRASWRRRTSLDMHYLSSLCEALARDPGVRDELTFSPNSSLYRSRDRLRYAESDLRGGRRSYRLVAVDANEAVNAVLERAAGGARISELAAALIDDDVDVAQATEFVNDLIEAQVLVCDLAPSVTGPWPLDDVIDQLASIPGAVAVRNALVQARAALDKLDAGGAGAERDRYEEAIAPLLELAPDADPGRMLLVDVVKPVESARLGRPIVDEVARATELLRSVMGSVRARPLEAWREQFVTRYGDREVPLVEALDEESGLGFQPSTSPAADASPLVAGLPWPVPAVDESWGPRAAYLLRRVDETLARGEIELRLTRNDMERLRASEQTPAPDALAALVSVAIDPARPSEFTVRMLGVSGPSGARLLGRFCHADQALAEAVRGHLGREEALRPHALFAEIVHLPEGRTGNLLARPLLRDHEIVFLGRTGAEPGARISVTDLLVSVRGDRVVLWSRKHDCEVIPRLTSAQNYTRKSLGIYRFLAALQGQGCLDGIVWSWGALEAKPFLPRLVAGRTVLARARWALSSGDLRSLTSARDDESRWRAARALREDRRLPRWIAVADADNELVLDLDNVMCVDVLADIARERPFLVVVEVWPPPEHSPVTGAEGRYANEMLVPFVARGRVGSSVVVGPVGEGVEHEFPPGSEWLYAKIYAGTAGADLLLRDVVGPLVRSLRDAGHVDRWFFVRYGDPDWHLRLRLHGAPGILLETVLPALLESVRHSGLAGRVQLDTYQREVTRYGGPEAVVVAEQMWSADSDAVVALLHEGGYDLAIRWRLAVAGIDLLFDDLGLDGARKAALARRLRDGYAAERGRDVALKKSIGERFRRLRADLEALVDVGGRAERLRSMGAAALLDRSTALHEPCERLRQLDAAGRLCVSPDDIAASHAHMFVNRLLRSEPRAHELVIYDFLDRLYRSRSERTPRR